MKQSLGLPNIQEDSQAHFRAEVPVLLVPVVKFLTDLQCHLGNKDSHTLQINGYLLPQCAVEGYYLTCKED